MKHTPGPWFRKPGANDNGAIHGGEDKRGVASVHFQEDPERYEANARLIAAAPELLKIVQKFVNALNTNYSASTMNYEFGADARHLLRALED